MRKDTEEWLLRQAGLAPPPAPGEPPPPEAPPEEKPPTLSDIASVRARKLQAQATPTPPRKGEATIGPLPSRLTHSLLDPRFQGRIALDVVKQAVAGALEGATAGYAKTPEVNTPPPLYPEEHVARTVGELAGMAVPFAGAAAATARGIRLARFLRTLSPAARRALVSAGAFGGFEAGRAPEEGESGGALARAGRGAAGAGVGAALPVAGKAAFNVILKPPLEAVTRAIEKRIAARAAAEAGEDPLKRLLRLTGSRDEGLTLPVAGAPAEGEPAARLVARAGEAVAPDEALARKVAPGSEVKIGAGAEAGRPSPVPPEPIPAPVEAPAAGRAAAGSTPPSGAPAAGALSPETRAGQAAEEFWRPAASPAEQVAKEAAATTIPPPPATTTAEGPLRERGYSRTLRTTGPTAPEVKANLPQLYPQLPHRAAVAQAAERIAANRDATLAEVLDEATPLTAVHTTAGQMLQIDAQLAGNFDLANKIADSLMRKGTTAGQATEAMRLWGMWTPEGVVKYATSKTAEAAKDLGPDLAAKTAKAGEIAATAAKDLAAIEAAAADRLAAEVLAGKLPAAAPAAKAGRAARKAAAKGPPKPPAKPEALLAARIVQSLRPASKAKTDPVRDMVDTLFKVAKETLPPRRKPVPRDPMELIRQAVSDRQTFTDTFQKAREIVLEKFEGNPDALRELQDFSRQVLQTFKPMFAPGEVGTFPSGMADKILRGKAGALGVKVGQLARAHFSETRRAGKDLAEQLVQGLGLSGDDAVAVANTLERRFEELVEGRKKGILGQLLRPQPDRPGQKPALQRLLELSNLGALDEDAGRAYVARKLGIPGLTPEDSARLAAQAERVQALPPGRARDLEQATLADMVGELLPRTIGGQLSAIQTMAQLLNPKTAIRNVLGNAGLAAAEQGPTSAVANMVDALTSLATGERTVKGFGLVEGWKGGGIGIREGMENALRGLDSKAIAGKYDIPMRHQFRGKVMRSLETVLRWELGATDFAFYNMELQRSKARQLAALGRRPTEIELEEINNEAILDGLRITFQDPTAIAAFATKIKRAANVIGIGKTVSGDKWSREFGMGDFLIKYPNTPANLIARGIEYSPAGLLETLANGARLIRGGRGMLGQDTLSPRLAQKRFVESLARNIVGTGIVSTGAVLYRLGILTDPEAEKDPKLRELNRALGLRRLSANLDKWKRYVLSGYNEEFLKTESGDRIASFDWFQPLAFPLALGASIEAGKGTDASPVVRWLAQQPAALRVPGEVIMGLPEAMGAALETAVEQPVFTGVRRAMKAETMGESIGEILKGAPSTIVPTLLNQLMQWRDNLQRSYDDPNWAAEVAKRMQARTPLAGGVSALGIPALPPQIGIFGEEKPRFEPGRNTAVNVFLNPAITGHITSDPRTLLMGELHRKMADTEHMPPRFRKTVTITRKLPTGERAPVTVNLTPEQAEALQRYVGEGTAHIYDTALKDPLFQRLSAHEKVRYLAAGTMPFRAATGKIIYRKVRPGIEDVVDAAKRNILGHDPETRETMSKIAGVKMRKATSDVLLTSVRQAREERGQESIKLSEEQKVEKDRALRDVMQIQDTREWAKELVARSRASSSRFPVTGQDLLDLGATQQEVERALAEAQR